MSGARYDVLLVDLDGTVYRGPDAIDGAVESLEAARSAGVDVAYVTNNASRGPDEVAEHLRRLGLPPTADDVVTSAQAAAALLAGHCAPGASVLVVGTEALADEVRAVGLTPVRRDEDAPAAVVQGHSPDTCWGDLAEATLALARGAVWVACNVDATLPDPRGALPGNGAMVEVLRLCSGREPEVAGKPAAPLLRQAVDRRDARSPLVVGDRLDTDIAGAHAVEADSLLVLTGISTAADVLAAGPDRRPTHLAADLRALADLDAVRVDAETAGWSAHRDGDAIVLTGTGDASDGDPAGALRALCRVAWEGSTTTTATAVRPDGEAAVTVIATLGLDGR